jgi:serine protease Do
MKSVVDGAFARWVRHALTIVAVLQLVLLAPLTARAETEASITAVVTRVSPSVVTIVSVRPPQPAEDKPGVTSASAPVGGHSTTAIGSGFIIDPSGFIATNRHVIEGSTSIFVVLADGVRYPAVLAIMADKADIALLRIDTGRKLPSLTFGDSDKIRVGDPVIAIGSPFGFDASVTAGIVSAVNRDIVESPFDDYIQTDAAINHGNSGGPLFNLAGEVIGMNSVLFAPGPGSAGLGFAVPSNDLNFVYSRLMKTGEIRGGMLPIHTQQVSWMLSQALETGDLQGALVLAVQDDGGMMLQGKIHPGDVIRSFNGQKVQDPRDLARKAAQAAIGGDAALEITRGGERETVHVTIQAWPDLPPLVLNNDGPRELGLELAAARGANDQPIVKVASIDPNGTAADSGIQKDDIIVEVQQTKVSEPDQALRIFWARSALRHHYAAVLVDRAGKLSWMALAVPD